MVARRDDEVVTKRDLELLRRELVGMIGGNSDKIEANHKMIEANGEKIETNRKMIEANGEKIETNRKMIEANGEKISRLIDRVVENSEAISKTLTREEYKRDYDVLLRGQDKMMAILLRLDQERAVTNKRLDRLEANKN